MPSRPVPARLRTRPWLVASLAAALALVVSGTVLSVPAYAANPVTPGNFRGLGFDQCEAPSQSAMSTWIKRSPFRAAGIYISGASRACQRQSNLTATWVRNQLAAGWHLMPITLGPQASCSTRYPRYGKNIDPTINPSATNTYCGGARPGRAGGPAGRRRRTDARDRPRQHALLRPRGLQHPQQHGVHVVGTVVHQRVDHRAAPVPLRLRLLLQRRLGHPDARRRAGPSRQQDRAARPALDRRLGRQGQHQLVVRPQRRVAALPPREAVPGRAQRDLGRRDDQHRPQLPQPAYPEAARDHRTGTRRRPRYTGSNLSDPRCTPRRSAGASTSGSTPR